MTIESKINYNEVKNAVKLWACCADGYDGAIGGIYGAIPWDEDMQSEISWDSVEPRFDAEIPCCPHFDLAGIVCDNESKRAELDKFASEIATRICGVYHDVINEHNEREQTAKKAHFTIVCAVVNGVCKYETIANLRGRTWTELFRGVADFINDKCESTWDMDFLSDLFHAEINKDKSKRTTFHIGQLKGNANSIVDLVVD